jgi:diguanylate cyclase (GGDEF)-like protein/putative nucleotidyltransferase with HDIG domain
LERKSEFIDLDLIQTMRDKDDMKFVDDALTNLIAKNKPYDITFRIHTASKKMKYIHSRAELILNDKGKPAKVLGVFQDVTSMKEKEIQLEYSAYNDFLTGVHNRRYYEENLITMDNKDNYPITIVMADINGLKLINDAFGHASGDNLLISAARLLKDQSRDKDIVARIGGDEFVIVMPKTSEKEAEEVIDKINENAKEVFVQSIELSISFGYKTKHKETEDIQDIYRSAEDLMYREKLLEIPSMRSGAIEAILTTLYEKDKGSEVHSRSVSLYAERLARLYGLDRQNIQEVKTAGILHDIGKIVTPLNILQKEGKLTPEEYEIIKNHSEIGFRILNSTSDMRNISVIILNHHERWDGTGYPRRVRGEDIPLKSRIIAIADAYDAMTSARSYRDIITDEEAIQELVANSGTQFDPKLVELFKDNYKEIIEE